MESRPPHFNLQANHQINSQAFDSQLFSDSQFFSQQYVYNPHYLPGSTNSNYNGGQSLFSSHQDSQNSIFHTSAKESNKKKTQPQIKERNRNWTNDEDEALCKAWLQISEDAIAGSDQPRVRLWDRVLCEFHKVLGRETERISSALMNRWSLLQSHLNKYSGFVQMVKRHPTSGFNIEDSIGAVNKLYYEDQGHHFKWHSCWLILKDSPKWFSYTKEQDEKKQKILQRKRSRVNSDLDDTICSSNPYVSTTTESINLAADDIPMNQEPKVLERPPGRKTEKAMRNRKNTDHVKAINMFAAEFGNLIKDQKEMSEKEINMINERELMKIEAKKAVERMRIEARQVQERVNFEKEIMMMDPNSVPTEEGKAWIIAQQKDILRRSFQGGQ